jgi:hypothetical protein
LSAYRDQGLPAAEGRALTSHLRGCPACTQRWETLGRALELLAELPRPQPAEPIAARVLTRLEVESRGASLALLFRSAAAARPLMLPSLVPAGLVLVAILATAVGYDRDPRAVAAARLGGRVDGSVAWAAWGTEANPAVPAAGVSVPRAQPGEAYPSHLLALGEGSFFLETVVARDGSVSAVTLLDGDWKQAGPLIDALRHERFEPGRFHGRPVAVSLYRLISRMDVWVPTT